MTATPEQETIAEALQSIVHKVDPGAIITNWVVVFATTSSEDPLRGAVGTEEPEGQSPHIAIGLLEMAKGMTTRRTLGI